MNKLGVNWGPLFLSRVLGIPWSITNVLRQLIVATLVVFFNTFTFCHSVVASTMTSRMTFLIGPAKFFRLISFLRIHHTLLGTTQDGYLCQVTRHNFERYFSCGLFHFVLGNHYTLPHKITSFSIVTSSLCFGRGRLVYYSNY